MNILRNLTIKDIKLNKKRTIGTLVGIILSCALITVVGASFYTLYNSVLQSEINNTGYYHLRIKDIDENEVEKIRNNKNVKEVITSVNIGYTDYNRGESYGYVGDVYSITKEDFDKLNYHIIEGEFPKNSNEILINRSYEYSNELKVGDTFDLVIGNSYEQKEFGKLVFNDANTIKMTVSGIIDRYGDLVTTGYSKDNYISYVVLNNPSNYKEDISSILGVSNYNTERSSIYDNYSINGEILRWEVFDFSDQVFSILLSFVGIVIFIIVVASVFSIRNSFAISTSQKYKLYGMLSSVGATKKQIRHMVLFEGFILGIIGITIGILVGEITIITLCILFNYLMDSVKLFNDAFNIVYKFSFVPIIISIIVSTVVIYLSVITSSIRAGRANIINNLKNSDDIKNKKFNVPKIINKLFGFGGVISYKYLKRSKKKYRVTVVSLTTCIFIFIVAFSFMGYLLQTIKEEYQGLGYNVYVNTELNVSEESQNKVRNMKNAYVVYSADFKNSENSDSLFSYRDYEHILNKKIIFELEDDKIIHMNFLLLNEYSLKKYAKDNNLDFEDIKDKIIIINESRDRAKEVELEMRRAFQKNTDYEVGDKFVFTNNLGEKIEYEVGGLVKNCPIGMFCSNGDEYVLTIVGSYEYISHKDLLELYGNYVYFDSDEPYDLVKSLKDLDSNLYIENLAEEESQVRMFILILNIIVYGFIIVVTLIGVSSVFNTINSNMELRSSDFATFKSIGMTKREFTNMINLEAIFYSFKSLMYGSILGVIGSFMVYKIIMKNYDFEYSIPFGSIFISIIFIFLIILIIMRYSVSKINKQNIIETIRDSNI